MPTKQQQAARTSQRRFLGTHVDLGTLISTPASSRLHGRRVPQNMRRYPSRRTAIGFRLEVRREPSHELVDPVSAERPALPRCEDRSACRRILRPLGDQLAQEPCGLRPERARLPLVAFAVQIDTRLRFELQVCDPQVGRFLDARAGICRGTATGCGRVAPCALSRASSPSASRSPRVRGIGSEEAETASSGWLRHARPRLTPPVPAGPDS